MKFKLSIIITLYNRKDLVIKAIDSSLKLLSHNCEIIVVDDGSTDNPLEKLNPFIHKAGIKYFYKENGGPASAKNFGISVCQGDFALFLDSDDQIYNADLLLIFLNGIDYSFDFYFCHKVMISDKDRMYETVSPYDSNREDLYEYILKYPLNYPGKHAYIFKVDAFKKTAGFNEQHLWGDALQFWRIFLKDCKYCVIPEILYLYNKNTISVSRANDKMQLSKIFKTLDESYEYLKDDLIKYKYHINWVLVLFLISLKMKKISHSLKHFKKMVRHPILSLKAIKYVFGRRINRG